MGNASFEQEILLGEIIISKESGKATFSSQVSFPDKLTVIVQDEQGRSIRTVSIDVDETISNCEFNLQGLKPGGYHAWIYAKEKVFVRRFEVSGNDKGGLMGRIATFFK